MTTTETTDELDALTRIAEMRTILTRAGRRDLGNLAWNELCPVGVPLVVRRDALRMAGWTPEGALAAHPDPRDALVIAALDEAADTRDERARGSGCPACAVQDYMQRGTQCDEHREHADRAAEYRAERDRREAGRG